MRGRRSIGKQVLDDIKEKRGYWKLKEEAIDPTLWRTRFERGYGPVLRQKIWMNGRFDKNRWGYRLSRRPSVSQDEFCYMELVPVLQVLCSMTHRLRGITIICWDHRYQESEVDKVIMETMEILIDVLLYLLFDWYLCPWVLLRV